MCTCRQLLLISMLMMSAMIGCAANRAADKPCDAVVGAWDIVTTEPAGVAKDARRLVFHPDGRYTALDVEGRELWAGTFDLDPAAQPWTFDHRSDASSQTGGDALGVCKVTDDTFTFACVVGRWDNGKWTGKPRPTQLTIDEADAVLQLRRATMEQPE